MQYTFGENYFLLPEFVCCPVTLSNVGSHLRILRILHHFRDDPKKGHPTW